MWIDLSPLKANRDYRLLFISQVVSFLGSMMTYVAIPVQVYSITQSSKMVGMVSALQLIPLLVFGLLGGSVADRFDRKRLLIVSELLMAVGAIALTINAFIPAPSFALIIIVSFLMQAVSAFHRPAMDALTQKLVPEKDYASIGALGSLRSSTGAILGPAIGGLLIASFGPGAVYIVDTVSFGIATGCIAMMKSDLRVSSKEAAKTLSHMWEGVVYASKKPVLIGTYLVDIIAMAFAFPVAIFPALSQQWGGADAAGNMFAAMSVGSLLMTGISGWTKGVKHKGRGVVWAASAWSLAILALAFATTLWQALLCLVIAGAFDMLSGLYRGIIWNEAIPNTMRGRMAGIEMISYMSGPLIGGARVGWMADKFGISYALSFGAFISVFGVLAVGLFIRGFWNYAGVNAPAAKA
ncbi:MAG: MFS transporter [Proteobacteria bacterium]|nr:MAG: MFS transporter [Pseudomonadota bacterium]